MNKKMMYGLPIAMMACMAAVFASCEQDEEMTDMSKLCRASIKHVKIYAVNGMDSLPEYATIGIYAFTATYEYDDHEWVIGEKLFNIPADRPTAVECPSPLYGTWDTYPIDERHFPGKQHGLTSFSCRSLNKSPYDRNTRFFAYYPYDPEATLSDSMVISEMIQVSRPAWTDPKTGITYYRAENYETPNRTMHVIFGNIIGGKP